MKKLVLLTIVAAGLLLITCTKEESSERFNYLTGTTWVADSLLANGIEAGGVGGVLEKFNGEVKFNTDGTGVFGIYSGTWKLAFDDTAIIISSDSLAAPLSTQIVELTKISLKITAGIPDAVNPSVFMKIRMTFKSK